jgi:ABC-type oligopeptide transport system ATPase subunit
VFKAVNDVSFDVRRGETLGLVGESGSGKTTIGRAIQGLIRTSQGHIALEGTRLEEIRGNRARRIASDIQTVFQDPFGSLNPARTIGSTLAEPLQVHESRLSRADVNRRVRGELDLVGLPSASADRYPVEFSGGQRQRIAIARALIARPRLVICDEAVSALDLSIQAQILNLLHEIQQDRGVSYLFITHDLAVVRHIADRVLVLRSGSLIDRFNAEDFEIGERAPYTQQLFEAAPVPDPARQRARRAAFESLATDSLQETR